MQFFYSNQQFSKDLLINLPPPSCPSLPPGNIWKSQTKIRYLKITNIQNHLKTLIKQGQLCDQVSDSMHEGLMRRVIRGGLDPDKEFVLQRMGNFVSSKEHIRILEELARIGRFFMLSTTTFLQKKFFIYFVESYKKKLVASFLLLLDGFLESFLKQRQLSK